MCTNELKQIIRQAQLIFITFEATCFDLIYRSSSGLHTMESSNAMHVGIPVHNSKIFKIDYASQLKSDWEILSGGVDISGV